MDSDQLLAKELALAYATVKLQNATSNGFLRASLEPPKEEVHEYFLNEFVAAFEYYDSCGTIFDCMDDSED